MGCRGGHSRGDDTGSGCKEDEEREVGWEKRSIGGRGRERQRRACRERERERGRERERESDRGEMVIEHRGLSTTDWGHMGLEGLGPHEQTERFLHMRNQLEQNRPSVLPMQ